MAESQTQSMYYVVFVVLKYGSFAEAQEKAAPDIAAHVARSKQLHEQGMVLMAGAFLDRPEEPLSTMAVCTSREAAEAYIQGDPFVLKGMVSNWYIRKWGNMFA
ncbi:MAG: YciI family protein [Aggregatilineales bacterium]